MQINILTIYHPIFIPENPINAIANNPAVINAMGIPPWL